MNIKKSYDVIVVGSGPAGSTAAIHLSKHGVDTAVLEKASIPRYKPCGGGIVQRVRSLLNVDIRETVEKECYVAELNFIDSNLRFSSERSFPIISMTMRDNFDFCLISAAKKSGTNVIPNCKVLDVIVYSDKIDLITNIGTFSARYVIAADGAMSTLAKKGGWKETRNLIPAIECEVKVPYSLMNKLGNAARFDFGLVSCGYAWTFPKKEHLSIGVLSMRRRPINLRMKFKEYLDVLGIDEILGVDRYGFVIPVTPRKDTFMKNRIILTGDAAGFVDPIIGEGITFAIKSGQIAANSLVEGNFIESRIEESYDSEIKETILQELKSANFLSKLLYDHPKLRNKVFGLYGQKLCETVTDIITGERTYKGIIRNPKNYFKLIWAWGWKRGN